MTEFTDIGMIVLLVLATWKVVEIGIWIEIQIRYNIKKKKPDRLD